MEGVEKTEVVSEVLDPSAHGGEIHCLSVRSVLCVNVPQSLFSRKCFSALPKFLIAV